jgi:hypothetical protein
MTPPDDRPGRTPDRKPPFARGPVPVRDLMRPGSGEPAPSHGAEEDPQWERLERGFDADDGAWIVRGAGEGAYGTGRTGTARLVAVHFFRADAPETPVREALVPAGVFPDMAAEELRALFGRATPIDLDR